MRKDWEKLEEKDNCYYVYEWFIIDTLEVFYVGKGKNMRRFLTKRNDYFNKIYNKYKCAVRIVECNLTEQEAYELEKERIAELKIIGQAKANFHSGGLGGDTGYRAYGKDNPMYGKPGYWRNKKVPEHVIENLRKVNIGRKPWNKGRKLGPLPEETKRKIRENTNFLSGENHPMYGKKHKPETIKKMKESHKNVDHSQQNKKQVILLKDNQIIKIFDSVKDFESGEWRKDLPRPNGILYLRKCLKNNLEFHGYRAVYAKDIK